MNRQEAIEILAVADVGALSPEDRADHLELLTLCPPTEHPDWDSFPVELREEILTHELKYPPASPRYHELLVMLEKGNYVGAVNSFLAARLGELGIEFDGIEGEPKPLLPCPCCGLKTLGARSIYEICTVCWWEDDGQDNEDADTDWGGPNRDLSLTQARVNFLREGISDLSRDDLRQSQDPASMYAEGRVFALDEEKGIALEPAAGWSSSAFE